jgi:hypothetical protein
VRPHCRGAMRPGVASVRTLERSKRAQGKPDARCTRGLVCELHKNMHTSIQVQRRTSGLPCAVVYDLSRDLPGEPSSVATIARGKNSFRELDASFGRRNHTPSPSARLALVSRKLRVHRIPPRVS